jgi:hypothetical protein
VKPFRGGGGEAEGVDRMKTKIALWTIYAMMMMLITVGLTKDTGDALPVLGGVILGLAIANAPWWKKKASA